MSTDQQQGDVSFPLTQPSLVHRAGCGDEQAVGDVYSRYKRPLRAHLLYKMRLPEERAEEFVQNFFGDKVVRDRCVAAWKQDRGKFRTFLLTTLMNYVSSEIRKELARKRRPEEEIISLDHSDARAIAYQPTVDEADLDWKRACITAALQRVQVHYESKGKSAHWELFHNRFVVPMLDGGKPPPYDSVWISKLGFPSPSAAFNALADAKRVFRRLLEENSWE